MKNQENSHTSSKGEHSQNRSKIMKQSLLKIRNSSIKVVSFLVLFISTLLIFANGAGSASWIYYPFGSMVYYYIILDFGYYFSFGAIASVIVYVHKPSNKRNSRISTPMNEESSDNDKSLKLKGAAITSSPTTGLFPSPTNE